MAIYASRSEIRTVRPIPSLEEVGKVIGELRKGLQMHKCPQLEVLSPYVNPSSV